MTRQELQSKMRKIAFGENLGSQFGQAMMTGAAGALATAGVAGAAVAAGHIYDAVTKAHDFRGMLSSPFNEDLHEHYQARPKEFNAAFSSLRTMNPEFSKDPMVAGTYMRRMMQNVPGSAGGYLVEALGHRKDLKTPMLDTVLAGGRESAKAGLSDALRSQSLEGEGPRQARPPRPPRPGQPG